MNVSELKKEGLKGSFWNFLTIAVNQVRNFIVSLVLARLLLPSDFGLISMAMVLNIVLDTFADFGLSNAIIRKETITDDETSTIFWLNIIMGASCSILVFLSAPLFSRYFEMPQLIGIVRVTSLSFFICSFGTLQTALFQRSLDFRSPFISRLVSGIVSGIIGIVLAIYNFGVWALVASNLFGWIVYSVMVWLMSSWRPKFIFHFGKVHDLWVFGWKMTLTTIVNRIFRQLDTLVIGKLYTATSLGLFERARSLNNLVVEYSFSSIRSVMLPTLSKLQNDPAALQYSILKLIHVISFLTFLFAGLMYICADDLIILLYGEKWVGAIELFKILGLFSITLCLPVVFDSVMNVVNKMNLYLWSGVARNAILLIAIPIGLSYGFITYVWSVSIARVLGLILYFFSTQLCIKLSVKSQLLAIVRYVIPFLLPLFLWKIIEYNTSFLLLNILIKVLFYIAIYTGLNFIMRNGGYITSYTLVRSLMLKIRG